MIKSTPIGLHSHGKAAVLKPVVKEKIFSRQYLDTSSGLNFKVKIMTKHKKFKPINKIFF